MARYFYEVLMNAIQVGVAKPQFLNYFYSFVL